MSRKRKFSLAEALESELICPITYEMPAEPVYAEDGRLYERSAIEQWFAADNRSSPLSAGASSFSPNRSGGGAGGGKREWKSPLLGD